MADIFHRAFYNRIVNGLRFTVYGKKNLDRQLSTVDCKPSTINQRGSVLVLVLWVLAMLAIISGFYSEEARVSRNLGQVSWDSLQGREAVRSILLLVSTRLKTPQDEDGSTSSQKSEKGPFFVPDGRIYELSFGDHILQFSLEDESGKLDINKATEEQLKDVLEGVLPHEKRDLASQLIDAILDWRDQDNLERYSGSEDEIYIDKTPSYMPANSPFRSIDELLLVDGISHDLFYGPITVQSEKDEELWQGGLKDIFTEYNDTNTVSTAYAPLPLKELLKTGLSDNLGMPNVLRLKLRYGASSYEVFFMVQASQKGYRVLEFKEMSLYLEKDQM